MKYYTEFPLEDGGVILVVTDTLEPEPGIEMASTRDSKVINKASQTFEAALETVKPAASGIIAKLRKLVDPPNEIEVEFGILMSADAGAVVATAGVEANYKVTLKWKRDQRSEKRLIEVTDR